METASPPSFWTRKRKIIAGVTAAVVVVTVTVVLLVVLLPGKAEEEPFPPAKYHSMTSKSKFLQEDFKNNRYAVEQLTEIALDVDGKCYALKSMPLKTDLGNLTFAEDGIEVVALDSDLKESLATIRDATLTITDYTREKGIYAVIGSPDALEQMTRLVRKKTAARQAFCIPAGTNMRSSKDRKALRIFHIDLQDVTTAGTFNMDLFTGRRKPLPFVPDELVNVWMNVRSEPMRNFHLGFIQHKFLQTEGTLLSLDVEAEGTKFSRVTEGAHVSIPELDGLEWGDAIMFRSAGPESPVHAAIHTIFNTDSGEKEYHSYDRRSVEFRCVVKY